MKLQAVAIVIAVSLLAACESGEEVPEETSAEDQASSAMTNATGSIRIVDPQGRELGFAQMKEEPGGVRFSLQLSGLEPESVHGIHIHERGSCQPPAFESAGGHLNPGDKRHGLANSLGPHIGDLPNITVREDSMVVTTVLANGVVRGDAPNGLRRPSGTALVIHEGPDDYTTDPSGDSGARIACGVISSGS